MALDTYTNLKAEINDYLNDTDLTTKIDTFIDLAEAKHRRVVRIREMIKRVNASTSVSSRYVALPTGFLAARIVRLLTDPVTILTFQNEHELSKNISATGGTPKFYTLHEELEFERVSDTVYTMEMIYYAKVTPLSDAAPSNAILENHPDLYLYGALLQAEPFLDNDERIPTWKGFYDDAIQEIFASDRKSRHIGPLISQPAGDRP